MLDILRDGIWQFVGAVLALLAIPFAYWLYLLQRRYKELAFGVLSQRALLSVHSDIAQRVQVSLDGTPVEHVFLIVLGIKNSGNVPILPADFLRPLSVTFGTSARLVSCTVSAQRPGNLGATVTQISDALTLQPLLLNPLDQVVLQVLVSAKNPIPEADTRIADVSTLVPATTKRSRRASLTEPLYSILAMVGALVSLFGSVAEKLGSTGIINTDRLVVLTTLLVALFLVAGTFVYLRNSLGPVSRRSIDDA